MPRFYFDIRQGHRFYPDREGLDLPDLASAETEAASAAAAIGSDLLPCKADEQVTVELRAEGGQPVAAITVRMTIERFVAAVQPRESGCPATVLRSPPPRAHVR